MTLAHWRDIAILILVIEALIGSVLILVMTFLLTRIVRSADVKLREVLQTGQGHVASIAAQTDMITREQVVRPVVRLHAANAGVRAFMRSLAKSAPFVNR